LTTVFSGFNLNEHSKNTKILEFTMKLQEKLDAVKKKSMAGRPPEMVATMVQEVENLVQSGIADRAIHAGETLPAFMLPDETGSLVSSRDLLAKGPLAVSFYRGVW
jgi:hypothetical protein